MNESKGARPSTKSKVKEGEPQIDGEEPADQIASSSTDDMFAFS
jgi:hypothetical protein